jgi:glycosyltransferase involved in cell wall biosynthesis
MFTLLRTSGGAVGERPRVRFLGTRGVPRGHGGFETAVEYIGLELVARGWDVTVYCQDDGPQSQMRVDTWNGINRVTFPARVSGPLGTILFDASAIRHAAKHKDVCVTFGYNSAFLNLWLKLRGCRQIFNMDGLEWKRARWSRFQRLFLYLQERIACRLGNQLIADHPEIHRHLVTRVKESKVQTIAYGSPVVASADRALLDKFGLKNHEFCTIIARPVEENTILEMVRTFSSRPRGVKLVVLGDFDPKHNDYHQEVMGAASDEVVFVGGIYCAETLAALRHYSLAYLHGHTVGGTNPSLVEALGAGTPIIAHDNVFNRWVSQHAAVYFSNEQNFDEALDQVLSDSSLRKQLSRRARARHKAEFRWSTIADQYEQVISQVGNIPLPVGEPSLIRRGA